MQVTTIFYYSQNNVTVVCSLWVPIDKNYSLRLDWWNGTLSLTLSDLDDVTVAYNLIYACDSGLVTADADAFKITTNFKKQNPHNASLKAMRK